MKVFRQAITAILFATSSLMGYGAETSSTDIQPILQRIMERAKLEDKNDQDFKSLYSYTREKTTEYRNGDGEVIKREDKTSLRHPKLPIPAETAKAEPAKNVVTATDKDDHPALKGQSFDKNELVMNEDLVNRFDFTLAGQETINGRPALVIDFVPTKRKVAERSLKDRFINKAAGRVWVDAAEYTIVKADLHLTKPVDVAFGLVGAVWKFDYAFERSRTPEGLWFTQNSNWHLEGREVVVNRIVDCHESTKNLQKVSTLAVR